MIPGQIFEHSRSWYVDVRHKRTGKTRTYYMAGGHDTKESVADELRRCYTGVEVLAIYPCIGVPTRKLTRIPAEDFEFGVREQYEKMMDRIRDERERQMFGGIRPIRLKPIRIKPLT